MMLAALFSSARSGVEGQVRSGQVRSVARDSRQPYLMSCGLSQVQKRDTLLSFHASNSSAVDWRTL